MVCKKCNTKIEGNQVFCPKCGTELRYVPDYDAIDEELNESIRLLKNQTTEIRNEEIMKKQSVQNADELKKQPPQVKKKLSDPLKSESAKKELEKVSIEKKEVVKQNPQKKEYVEEDYEEYDESDYEEYEEEAYSEEWEEFRLDREVTPQEKKRKAVAKIVGLVSLILVLVVGIVLFVVMQSRKESFDIQYKKAVNYEKEGDFSNAVLAYENALNVTKKKEEMLQAAKDLGMLYAENKDTKNAVYYLNMAVENGCQDHEVINVLVHLYELQGNSDAIKKLAEVASNQSNYSLFEKYLLNLPVFNYKSGTYNEYLTVEITSDDNETIYYTMDDTQATTDSNVYAGPIQIADGTTVIHAITVNRNNLVSEEVVVTYVVETSNYMDPHILPESGSFTEFRKVTIDNDLANCKVYYTIDGTEPNQNSIEYTGPFDMPAGNHVVKAISINTETGATSNVVSKVYNLDLSEKYDLDGAGKLILDELLDRGEVIDSAGTMTDGSSCVFEFVEEVTIGSQNFYIMKRFTMSGNTKTDTGIYYAVNVMGENVFLAVKSGEGIYNLDIF